jgi:hypothetical protein
MAKKDDRKKQKKRLKEQKRTAAHREHLAAKAIASRYPRIIIDPTGGEPGFVEEVRRVVGRFSFDDPECCDEIVRNNYMLMAKLGMRGWRDYFRERIWAESESSVEAKATLERNGVAIFSHLGKWIFNSLPRHLTAAFSPATFFQVDLTDAGAVVRFNLLKSVEEPTGRLYIPPDEPTVVMQGATWRVGLYRHALERLCSRLQMGASLRYTHYAEISLRFAHRMLTYTPMTLHDGQESLRVDFELPLTTAYYDYYAAYARTILHLPESHTFPRSEKWYAVMGYLPLQVQGKYARAKTFLLPGFMKTPEFGLARRAKLSLEDHVMLTAMTDETKRTGDLAGDTIAAIKWYHDNGVPQVFRPSQGDDGPTLAPTA